MSRSLPKAPRLPFRVRLRGRNVVAEDPVHPAQGVRLGFWATCFVEAANEREAGDLAFQALFDDPELKSAVKNDPASPPAVDVEDVIELEQLPTNIDAGRPSYEWFKQAAPLGG
ncbi:MAG: hypothetical protein JKY65_09385 [Planctomycetes bacterium]|nr:hypothetical protein [Planctomycetota bacterium]